MNINEYKKILEVANLPLELKEKLEDVFNKFNKFNTHLQETLNITEEVVTARSEIFLKQRVEELLDLDNIKDEQEGIEHFLKMTTQAFTEYLEYEKYDSVLSEELIECFNFIMELTVLSNQQ